MSIAGQYGGYMPALLVTDDSSTSLPIAKAFKECGAQKLRLQYQKLRYTISSAIHIIARPIIRSRMALSKRARSNQVYLPFSGEIHYYIVHCVFKNCCCIFAE